MKILVCADGSKRNKNSLEFAALVAKAVNADVTVLHVVENGVDESEEIFSEAVKIIEKKGVEKIKTRKLKGRADVQILKHAQRNKYDLVIVGSHGVQYLRAFLFGDVAVRIIEHIKTPILVIRDKRPKIRKILFCTGGSSFAENAVRFGSNIAQTAGVKATILHVIPELPAMYRGFGMGESLSEFLECNTPECIALKRAAKILEEEGIETEVKLSHGLPSEEILVEAEGNNYDLIVLGSHGMSSPSRFLLGDVACRVVKYSKTPCLLVK
ncbi:MAG: hypothetical protein B6U72_00050 [Candidatus Altiarchaeales archaeon ex4484_2]|nr:MAG: hypothetical protein B6U72_00050 [Candidatus Altiarchaeales archaeon ex4484_2]